MSLEQPSVSSSSAVVNPDYPASSSGQQSKDDQSRHEAQQAKDVTPQDYMRAIIAHSKRHISSGLYAGDFYIDFEIWLQRSHNPSDQDDHYLAILYDFARAGPARVERLGLNDLATLQNHPRSNGNEGQVIILRGYPPPEWINTIGAKYQIDAEFFCRHLDFFITLANRRAFALPSLPSTSANIHKLRITTILLRESEPADEVKEDLETRRIDEHNEMRSYHRHFQREAKWGDSIVREFARLDGKYVILEQEISICVVRNGEGWLALVWMDIGRNLAGGPRGPWSVLTTSRDHKYKPLPIIQHHQKMSNHQTMTEGANLPNNKHPAAQDGDETYIPQSTAVLPFELETFLDESSAKYNAFYALSNIFRHAAFSEMQFLNLVEYQIDRELGVMEPEDLRSHTLNNLHFFKSTLVRHIRGINDTLRSLKDGGPTFSSGGDKALTSAMTETLIADFERILADALALSSRCTEFMNIMMNRVIISESRKAMEQSERLRKLTMLAAFFVPLSFTTSLFGMNFQEFGQGHLSIWLFVVVSIPVLVASFSFYKWDVWAGVQTALRWIVAQREKLSKIKGAESQADEGRMVDV